ncbi:mitochondrial intermediate peptidase [Oratosquilla oratoria]|uniref:mitochondrial intermediate peptidase n=1 Tax=Oratosquilla oratoria TaxID=337810 RepID=UPI003F77028D
MSVSSLGKIQWRRLNKINRHIGPAYKYAKRINDNAFPASIRFVNTWTPLASAFNTKPSPSFTLQLQRNDIGLFGIPQLSEPDGFYLLKEEAILECDALVKECCSPKRSRKMVEVFDHLSDSLCRVADLAEFIRIAHPGQRFANGAENACIAIGGLVEKLNTHKELYDSLKEVVENGDKVPTTAVDHHVGKLFLFDFEQSGIHLDEKNRQKVAALNEAILTLGQHFMNGTLQPRSVKKSHLPDAIRHHFALEGDNVVVTGLYADSHMEITREAAYKIFLHPDPHQEYLLQELLKARHEMATLCGFPSYAHRALRGSLAEEPDLVTNFLEQLASEIRPRADEDFAAMGVMKKAHNRFAKEVSPWDVPFFTNMARQTKFNVNSSDLANYFSLGAVMEGYNSLMQKLFEISLVVEEPSLGELWVPEVYKLAVVHSTEGLLGHIYCDFYERVGKLHQDCHFTIRGGKERPDGTYQNPVVVVHLNLPSPTWSTPSLLTPGMVENLFHEMGHAMHSMLARTKYQHVTGTRCSTDFAEVPSILMEHFAMDPRVIHSYARHYKTGEKIPFDLLQKLVASKSVFAASEMQLQTFYSLLDQHYHSAGEWLESCSTTQVLQEVHSKYYSLPYVPSTAWQLRFGHLVGYGAKYYAYLVSRAVASWIWQKYFVKDPFNREMGEKYRQEVLVHGGGKPPRAMVGEFLGKEVGGESLTAALVADLDKKKKKVQDIL